MSFATMRNDDWTTDSYLALDGLSPKVAIAVFGRTETYKRDCAVSGL